MDNNHYSLNVPVMAWQGTITQRLNAERIVHDLPLNYWGVTQIIDRYYNIIRHPLATDQEKDAAREIYLPLRDASQDVLDVSNEMEDQLYSEHFTEEKAQELVVQFINAWCDFQEQTVAIIEINKVITERELDEFEPERRAAIVAEREAAYEAEKNAALEQVKRKENERAIEARQAAIDATNLEDTEFPEKGGECCICMDEFKQEDSLKKCPKCRQCIHTDCILKTLVSMDSCPLCRENLFKFHTA